MTRPLASSLDDRAIAGLTDALGHAARGRAGLGHALEALARGLDADAAWIAAPTTAAWSRRAEWVRAGAPDGSAELRETWFGAVASEDAVMRTMGGGSVVVCGGRDQGVVLGVERAGGWSPVARSVVQHATRSLAGCLSSESPVDPAARNLEDDAVGLWTWDLVRDALHVDPRARAALGLDAGGFSSLSRSVHVVDRARFDADVQRWLGGEVAKLEGDYRLQAADGGWRWFGVRGEIVDSAADGTPKRARGTLRDIDRHKRAELDLKEARDAAEAESRAKSEFLAGFSTELRTPMNAVVGMARLLRDTRLDVEQQEFVGILQQSSEALIALVDHIHDLSRIEAGHLDLARESFQPATVVAEVGESIRQEVNDKRLTLHVVVAPEGDPPLVMGDSGRLRQVLSNLMRNALDFTESGSIWLGARWAREGDAVRWTFEVVDSGRGIAADRLSGIFSPFGPGTQAISGRMGSHGLALPISHRIVEGMGSSLQVRSGEGVGTTFTFDVTMPVAPVQAPAGTPSTLQASRSLRVLLVEDDPTNQLVALRMLQRLGHRPDVASDGPEAIEAVGLDTYDVILMDLSMPGMDGVEATRQILAELGNQPRPRIFAMTAMAFEEDRRRCREVGMDGFMTKPVRLEKLQEMLAERAGETVG